MKQVIKIKHNLSRGGGMGKNYRKGAEGEKRRGEEEKPRILYDIL
jgi:hypothetical protein